MKNSMQTNAKAYYPFFNFCLFSGGKELRGNYRTSGGLEKEEAGKQGLLYSKFDPLDI